MRPFLLVYSIRRFLLTYFTWINLWNQHTFLISYYYLLFESFSDQEVEWQQVSSSLQDSSQYSSRSQQFNTLDGLHSSSNFQILKSCYQIFCNCTKITNNNWRNRSFHVSLYFRFSSKVLVLTLLFAFFQFYSVVNRDSKVHNSAGYLFLLLILIRPGRLAEIRWSVYIS